jgi:hypothetical protein
VIVAQARERGGVLVVTRLPSEAAEEEFGMVDLFWSSLAVK